MKTTTQTPLRVETNDPARRGQVASKKLFFGEFSRFAVFAIHTRSGDYRFALADAGKPDLVTEMAQVIDFFNSEAEAVAKATALARGEIGR